MTMLSRRRAGRSVPPSAKPDPMRTQEQLRQRRRAGLSAVYAGEFDLAAEIAAIVHPLAARIAHLSSVRDARSPSAMFSARVADLADAIHGELIGGAVGWLAELDAKQRTERMAADSARRAAAIRLLVDLAPRPPAPEVTPENLASGRWSNTLVEMAQPYTAPLADLLGRSYAPNHPALRGSMSRSERLCDLLREVDSAARQLELRIETAERAKPPTSRTPHDQTRSADVARAELRKMGIEP